jgi:hypothetical protein
MPQSSDYWANLPWPTGTKRSVVSTTSTVKSSAGRVIAFQITTAGSTVGTVKNGSTTVAQLPDLVSGPFRCSIFCSTSIVVTPGTGQTVDVWYL